MVQTYRNIMWLINVAVTPGVYDVKIMLHFWFYVSIKGTTSLLNVLCLNSLEENGFDFFPEKF